MKNSHIPLFFLFVLANPSSAFSQSAPQPASIHPTRPVSAQAHVHIRIIIPSFALVRMGKDAPFTQTNAKSCAFFKTTTPEIRTETEPQTITAAELAAATLTYACP